MMNFIGKGLVLLYTVMCLAALCLALVIYYELVDWGRSEPRVVRGEVAKTGSANDQRVASEFDRSVVLYQEALAGRDLAIRSWPAGLAPAVATLHEAEARLVQNHLFYAAKLKELRSGAGDIVVNALPADVPTTDTPGKAIGKPVPNVKVDGLDRSMASYREMLAAEQKKLDPVEEEVRALAKKNSDVSFVLTGKDETGKKSQHGLFDLIDDEFKTQQGLLAQRDYVQPLWANANEEARRFDVRRTSLEGTLDGLNAALKAKKAREK